MIFIILALVSLVVLTLKQVLRKIKVGDKIIPTSVNYHFTRECNYKCGFCFHTQTNSDMLSEEDAKKGLRLLKEAGMKKINFAGGEPFLKPKFLGPLVEYCKKDLKLESVSIVSNGSKIKKEWFEIYGKYIDVLAISVDSFNEEINKKIGRGNGKHIEFVYKAQQICEDFNIIFKLNSVINIYNYNEDMNTHITKLNPKRWKVFQCLILDGENSGGKSLRDAQKMVVTKDQMDSFLSRHDQQKCLVPESNDVMKNSYLILDEKMRFLNCREGKKDPTQSTLEVGVEKAIQNSGFSNELFEKRGGIYEWTKEEESCNSGCEQTPELEW